MVYPIILLIGAGLAGLKIKNEGVSSLEDAWQLGDVQLPPPPPNYKNKPQNSFVDDLSIKETVIGLSLISIVLFSKFWK